MTNIPDNISLTIANIIVDTLSHGDQVAFPSFGNFSAVKSDEEIVTDEVTGERTLLPPSIKAQFTPALKFTKELNR